MITYDEAKAIALNFNKKVNSCYEYDKGFAFFEKNVEADGGSLHFIVIKETGKIVSMADFICNYRPNPKYKTHKF